MNKEMLQALISAELSCDFIAVEGDDGRHFSATVVSVEFEGLSMINQHKRVYATLGKRMENDEIHALALKTYTPAQWEAKHAQ